MPFDAWYLAWAMRSHDLIQLGRTPVVALPFVVASTAQRDWESRQAQLRRGGFAAMSRQDPRSPVEQFLFALGWERRRSAVGGQLSGAETLYFLCDCAEKHVLKTPPWWTGAATVSSRVDPIRQGKRKGKGKLWSSDEVFGDPYEGDARTVAREARKLAVYLACCAAIARQPDLTDSQVIEAGGDSGFKMTDTPCDEVPTLPEFRKLASSFMVSSGPEGPKGQRLRLVEVSADHPLHAELPAAEASGDFSGVVELLLDAWWWKPVAAGASASALKGARPAGSRVGEMSSEQMGLEVWARAAVSTG